jgi:hypothetical protein
LTSPRSCLLREAHLLFTDAPKPLIQQIERLVRLVRSKGVGVFFVTQSAADVPETVLAQLGNRIAHSLRAFTPAGMKLVRTTAAAFRENRGVDVNGELTALGVGEAFVSVLDDDGIPTRVERVSIIPLSGQVGPISDLERRAVIDASPRRQRYGADLPEAEAVHSFYNRMRRQRGIAEQEFKGAWQEGDFRKFLPDLGGAAPPRPTGGLQNFATALRNQDGGAQALFAGAGLAGGFAAWKVTAGIYGLITAGTNLNTAGFAPQAAAASLGGQGIVDNLADGKKTGFLSNIKDALPWLAAAGMRVAGPVGAGITTYQALNDVPHAGYDGINASVASSSTSISRALGRSFTDHGIKP